MKTVKYLVSPNEPIECIPSGAIITNAILIHKEGGFALIYFPKKIEYIFEGEHGTESWGCASISFGVRVGRHWERSEDAYLNIERTENEFIKKFIFGIWCEIDQG